jgi:hypothetical protein
MTEEEEVAAADALYIALNDTIKLFFKQHGWSDLTQRLATEMLLGVLGNLLWKVKRENQEAACKFAADDLNEIIAEIVKTDDEVRKDIADSRRRKFRIVEAAQPDD